MGVHNSETSSQRSINGINTPTYDPEKAALPAVSGTEAPIEAPLSKGRRWFLLVIFALAQLCAFLL